MFNVTNKLEKTTCIWMCVCVHTSLLLYTCLWVAFLWLILCIAKLLYIYWNVLYTVWRGGSPLHGVQVFVVPENAADNYRFNYKIALQQFHLLLNLPTMPQICWRLLPSCGLSPASHTHYSSLEQMASSMLVAVNKVYVLH